MWFFTRDLLSFFEVTNDFPISLIIMVSLTLVLWRIVDCYSELIFFD